MENPLQQSSSDSFYFVEWSCMDIYWSYCKSQIYILFELSTTSNQVVKFMCKQNYVKLANQGRQFVVNKIMILQIKDWQFVVNKIMFKFANQR